MSDIKMTDEQVIELVKEITMSNHEFKHRYSNVFLVNLFISLLTTIESQKEEIKRLNTDFPNLAREIKLEKQIESLKAITELAVKGLEEVKNYTAPDYPFKTAETIAEFHTLIGLTLSEIARLSHELDK